MSIAPGLTCCQCERALYPLPARHTLDGWVHANACPARKPAALDPEHIEDLAWMADNGESLEGAAKRLGVHQRTVERFLVGRGCRGLLQHLRSNGPRDWNAQGVPGSPVRVGDIYRNRVTERPGKDAA